METSKKSFANGDWVEVIQTRLKGFTGYILYRLIDEEGYIVKLTKDPKGCHVEIVIWIGREVLAPFVRLVEEEDLHALIDLALSTNDKQWFLELTDQLPFGG
ncbi:IDEAL domain-containing protein [Cytobacillus firmus]|uniref:IDEAL domain-containing protein n=2 Tax=Cytobacillus TaxID=2675230 RepID=A0A366JGR5_CYTFI|nr:MULTISPECIES: IDEAL domain-containing protein [Cytobacillus]RBP86179.1 IDEAL domain-containing protein [Cytobacillus firmus]TDX36408.1 IDEAL domain-containing protein [Cytobacillus oceanisediminis]